MTPSSAYPTTSTPLAATPEEKKKASKEAKKGRKREADKKRKRNKALTKGVESLNLEKIGAAGANTPAGRSGTSTKSSRTNRTDSSGKVTKPEKAAKLPYREVSQFSQAMADGKWLLTERCCKSDPKPSKEQVIEAWDTARLAIDNAHGSPRHNLYIDEIQLPQHRAREAYSRLEAAKRLEGVFGSALALSHGTHSKHP